jgi:phosphoglucomutase
MNGMMEKLRTAPPKRFAGRTVVYVKDYLTGETLYRISGVREKNIDLPASNVLQFILDDKTTVTARPSGTEPKIKFYISSRMGKGMELEKAEGLAAGKIWEVTTELDKITGA